VAGGPDGPSEIQERVPPRTRAFVGVFLAVFVVCGFLNLDAWPLTGWRLFSHLRQDHQVGWQAYAVDAAGRETPIAFARLGPAYQGSSLILREFASLPEPRQLQLCDTWGQAVRLAGRQVLAVRVYRVEWDESRSRGRRERAPSRTAAYECRGGSVTSFDPASGDGP
jgi:hypothetical protein